MKFELGRLISNQRRDQDGWTGKWETHWFSKHDTVNEMGMSLYMLDM